MIAAVSHSLDIVTASHGMGETGFGMGFQCSLVAAGGKTIYAMDFQ